MRKIHSAPAELVTQGRFNLGAFKEPFQRINPLEASYGRPFPLPKIIKNFRLKEWQHFALTNKQVYISIALFNAKTLALAQISLYVRKDGKINFYERFSTPWSVYLPDTLWDNHTQYSSRGLQIEIQNQLRQGHHKVEFKVRSDKHNPPAQGSFTCLEDLNSTQPIVVCLPLGKHSAMYSHKIVIPIEGKLHIEDRQWTFRPQDSYGLIDIHKGYYPFVMKWHWSTGGGFDQNNQLIGFNLTDNQVQDQERFNENCVWVNGKIHLLPPVKFIFDSNDICQPWTIRDQYGLVDLCFKPEVLRKVEKNALLIKSRYRAPFGTFWGKFKTHAGTTVVIEDYFGMSEVF